MFFARKSRCRLNLDQVDLPALSIHFLTDCDVGMLGQMFDGIQRPLEQIKKACNDSIYIPRGIEVPVLPRDKKWHFRPLSGKDEDGMDLPTPTVQSS